MPVATSRLLDRPVFVLGVYRSGTSMLFTLLNNLPGIFSMRTEAQHLWKQRHHPSAHGWRSEVLTVEDATPEDALEFEKGFYHLSVPNRSLVDSFDAAALGLDQETFVESFMAYTRRRNPPYRGLSGEFDVDADSPLERALEQIKESHRPLRFVEKTPSNCLRVDFINALFPDALFIYLKRDGRANVSSLMEGWRAEHDFVVFDVPVPLHIPDLEGKKRWSVVLPPGWQNYVDKPLEEVTTFQWLETNRICMESLARIAPSRVHTLFYEDLVDHTEDELRAIAEFIGVPFTARNERLAAKPPVVAAITPPERDKWKRQNGEAIERMWPVMKPMMRQMGYAVDGDA